MNAKPLSSTSTPSGTTMSGPPITEKTSGLRLGALHDRAGRLLGQVARQHLELQPAGAAAGREGSPHH